MTSHASHAQTPLLCPCGSGSLYSACCEPLILNRQSANTAEQLMRSRYSAYCLGHYLYIQQTYVPDLQASHPVAALAEFGDAVSFIGLRILADTQAADQVHFIASYLQQDRLEQLEEVSSFEQLDGRWYYRNGKLIAHPAVKIGRNDNCPCGSGIKFKKCQHQPLSQ
ncbi:MULTISPECIES: YchJ family protein [Rheinheimera]|uniref:YchJ family protein n=1 Tax=Rheinheimera marina TaxID=1774958 RepID=A0ABV9JQY8_9GAMM